MDRPALDVNGEDADLMRGSFDKVSKTGRKGFGAWMWAHGLCSFIRSFIHSLNWLTGVHTQDMDDVSVVTDASEEVAAAAAAANGKAGKGKKKASSFEWSGMDLRDRSSLLFFCVRLAGRFPLI